MGQDKRFLEVGGNPLLHRVLSVLEAMFSEVLVIVAEPSPDLACLPHRVITDVIPDCATLGGLFTGLSSAKHERVFAVACDMPFLNTSVIERMIELGQGYDVVVANLAKGLQPMHAVYSKACLPRMHEMIETHNLKLQELVVASGLRVRSVVEDEIHDIDKYLFSFVNVNTPSDLELARKLLSGQHSKLERTF
jgi:molybdopterin-guanine dinucleotide biosynthesis protein A